VERPNRGTEVTYGCDRATPPCCRLIRGTRLTPSWSLSSHPAGALTRLHIGHPRVMASVLLPLHLPDHLHTLLISTVCFAAVHHLGAPEFAQFLLGKKAWEALGPRVRVGWCVSRYLHSHPHRRWAWLILYQAITRIVARSRVAHPPTGRALSPRSCPRGRSRVWVGPTRRHALCGHERVRARV
jgi:hypothetical protein